MIEIGSKVMSLLTNVFSNIIGTVSNIGNKSLGPSVEYGRLITIKIEEFPQISQTTYEIGGEIYFYEKDVELLRSSVDPDSLYQYCSKCDILTINKPRLCCDHKGHQDRLS